LCLTDFSGVVTKGGLSQPLGYFDDDSRHVKLRRSADRLPVPQMIEYGTGVVFHVIMTSAADRQGMLDALGRHPDRTTGRAGGGRGTGGAFPNQNCAASIHGADFVINGGTIPTV
jgi:hypothetical protein